MRQDILSLTLDDLATLSNRGTVKRAQRDLDEGKSTPQIEESADGTVTVSWSDGITCVLPPNTTLAGSRCTCPSVEICRHLVQSVLVYQVWADTVSEGTETAPPQPWNPGDIADELLASLYTRQVFGRLRRQFDDGQVFELVRGVKPLARILTLSVNVRFLVPGDPRYAACDCADPAPCGHVALAVWAFRRLEGEAGLIESAVSRPEPPLDLLRTLETGLADVLEIGFNGAQAIQRLRQLAPLCREHALMWHADLLEAIGEAYDRYCAGDARFSAQDAATLMGELLIRIRAFRHGAVPALFVGGSTNDRNTAVDKMSLVGLGCAVEFPKGATRLSSYLQEQESGRIIAVQKDFAPKPIPQGQPPEPPFAQLARANALTDTSFAALSQRQGLIKGGKRTASGVYLPARAKTTGLAPQQFAWEKLKPPLLVDDFAEMRARFNSRPPSTLRPRRVGENLQVVPLERVENAAFDPLEQRVVAAMVDTLGERTLLTHPYTERGRSGVDTLLWHLQNVAVRFVCGSVQRDGSIAPIALIFEESSRRFMVQPWIDQTDAEAQDIPPAPSHISSDPTVYFPSRVMGELGELVLNGLRRTDARPWRLLVEEGERLGFVRLLEPLRVLSDRLETRQHQLNWDWQAAAHTALETLALFRFAQEGAG